jgi:hypothetical protein
MHRNISQRYIAFLKLHKKRVQIDDLNLNLKFPGVITEENKQERRKTEEERR